MNGTGFGKQERNSDKVKVHLMLLGSYDSAPDWDSGETGSSLLLQANLMILLQLRFPPP